MSALRLKHIRLNLLYIFAGLALALIFVPCALSIAEEIPVNEVQVEGLYSIGKEELLYLLDIHPGALINGASIGRGIKRAFRKGIFEDISVSTADGSPGTLVVTVRERDVISSITTIGNTHIPKKYLIKHMGYKKDGIVNYEKLEVYRNALTDRVKMKGYPDARIDLDFERTRKPYRVALVVRLEEGASEKIKKVLVYGEDEKKILPYMHVGPGDVFDQEKLGADIKRLETRFRKRDYINPVIGPYTYSEGVLHMRVNLGRRLAVRFKGNSAVWDRTLIKMMPFQGAGDIRDDLVQEAVMNIMKYYRTKGYPNVQIAPVISGTDDNTVINFYVYEGKKVRVKAVHIHGTSIDSVHLRDIVSLREGGLYNPDELTPGADALKDFYVALGYLNVAVDVPDVEISPDGAEIHFHVTEGRKYVIAGITATGINRLRPEDVYRAIGLSRGSPYNEVDISDARRRALELYRSSGYHDSRILVEPQFDGTGNVDVAFRVTEGRMLVFGKTVIRGNQRTRLKVIKRELTHEAGQPFDNAKLLRARQRIYKTGLYSDIDIDALQRYGDRADIEIKVKEGRAGTIDFGIGYGEYDQVRGFADVGYNNLFGLNRRGSARVEASSLARRYILKYSDPWFMDRKTPFNAHLLREERREINIDNGKTRYRLERHTAGVGVEKQLSDKLKTNLLYEFSLTRTFDVQPDIILSKEDTGTLLISGITPSITYDTRDNPFNPKRGVFAGVSVKAATHLLFSETDFLKLVAYASTYRQAGKRVVLAGSLRGGIARGFRSTQELPLIERFFLGGRNTVRGFAQDSLGPKGVDGNPVGGNVFLLANAEIRYNVIGNWSVVLFFDTGGLWIDQTRLDFADLRYTTGLSLQYVTPVGPLSVAYGYKLDRRTGEAPGEVHFNIGYVF